MKEEPPENKTQTFQEGQAVELTISSRTDLGYKAIINDTQEGMLYKNEVFEPLKKGQKIAGFIKKVRIDGKIDLSLQRPGYEKIGEISNKIISEIRAKGGFIPVTDKSPAEIIYSLFGISKKTYKKAIGALYRKRLIIIESNGIRHTEKTHPE